MNFEICKKCLSNTNFSVRVCCDEEDYSKGNTSVLAYYAVLYTKSGKFALPCCRIDCGFAIDIKFLDEKRKWHYGRGSFYIKTELLEEFFILLDGCYAYRIAESPNDCSYFLEHQLYDWSLEK